MNSPPSADHDATPGAARLFDQFGTYILPGRVSDPTRGLEEAREAE